MVDHEHHHGHHHHHDVSGMSTTRLILSTVLTSAFVLLELFVGLKSNSLALLSDAGHNFTDAVALALSWYAVWIARKPASATRTFGYHRVGILTAFINAVSLVVIALLILHEAWLRFLHPVTVAELPMIYVALAALVINTVIALGLQSDAKNSVNIRSAFIHMLGDALASAGVVMAGILIHFTGWTFADPLVSALIGIFILISSREIVMESVNILLEGTPRGLDVPSLVQALLQIPGVADIHDLHVWTITDGMHALSCHLHITAAAQKDAAVVVLHVKQLLADRYQINHSTIETECQGCESGGLYCQINSLSHHECD